jgi:hypothetical protein
MRVHNSRGVLEMNSPGRCETFLSADAAGRDLEDAPAPAENHQFNSFTGAVFHWPPVSGIDQHGRGLDVHIRPPRTEAQRNPTPE